tara:strand:+ start:2074 stop:3141 length:1068 start_codon:yes stop_codon:yes gene_type:complete
MSTPEELRAQILNAPESESAEPDSTPQLTTINLIELLNMDLPEREFLLDPIIAAQGLLMVYAERGLGKTYFSLSIALAVAAGGKVLGYEAPEPRNVLYVDGEMPFKDMQSRIRLLANGMGADHDDLEERFSLISPELQTDIWPSISSKEGRDQIEQHLTDGCLLVLDNLSTLSLNIAENEADAQDPIIEWLVNLRKRHVSVLQVHHAGKGGKQRGTSRREDILDVSIQLNRPTDYDPEEGARFEVHYSKARGIYGKKAAPFEATLIPTADGEGLKWVTRPLIDKRIEQVMKLVKETNPDTGRPWSIRNIAQMLDMTKSTVANLIKRGEKKEEEEKKNIGFVKDRPSRKAEGETVK